MCCQANILLPIFSSNNNNQKRCCVTLENFVQGYLLLGVYVIFVHYSSFFRTFDSLCMLLVLEVASSHTIVILTTRTEHIPTRKDGVDQIKLLVVASLQAITRKEGLTSFKTSEFTRQLERTKHGQ